MQIVKLANVTLRASCDDLTTTNTTPKSRYNKVHTN